MQVWEAVQYVSGREVISLEASVERVCNIGNRNFQKFSLAFRVGQFVDNTFSADNFTCTMSRRLTVSVAYGSHQRTSLRLGPKVITVTVIRVIHPHHIASRRWRASVSN